MKLEMTSRSVDMQCLLFLLVGVFWIANVSAQPTGADIMLEQKNRHDATQEITEEKMTLRSAKGKVKERRMITYSMKPENGGAKTLIKFLEPSSIHNVGLLTWEQSDANEDDQWLYLPASKKIKRISGGGKANPFMGTDFSFEDMRPESITTHEYEVLGEEEVDGHLCWIVQALPATKQEKKASGYSKRIFWIRQDIYFTVKTEFYNRKKKLAKLGVYGNLEEVGDGAWRSNEISMSNLKRKTQTILVTQNRDLTSPMNESTFETQALKRPPIVK